MELLDRYLEAVKKHLPWQRQDDIIAELRANLESQLEEKEQALGRALTTAEAEEWLKQLGSPIQMAAHYKPQQYLIGPNLFPIYTSVLRISFTWCMIIYLIVGGVEILTGTPSLGGVAGILFRLPSILITTAAWVTLVFAAIEVAVTHNYIKLPPEILPAAAWSPGALPPLTMNATQGKKPGRLSQTVAEVIFGFIFLVWLLLIPSHPVLLFGPGAAFIGLWGPHVSTFQLAPVWIHFYWWMVALTAFQLAWHSVELLRGAWQKERPAMQIAIKAGGLIPLIVLYAARDRAWVMLRQPELDLARFGATLDIINKSINWVVFGMLTIIILQLVVDIGRLGLIAWRQREGAID
jgi:hypothetical protein